MRRNRQSGFTLLELLIALGLLAMIAAALASSIGLGARLWERSKAYPVRDDEILLRAELRQWIEAMKPPTRAVGMKQSAAGTAQSFSFLTTALPPVFPGGSETRVTISLKGGQKASDLIVLLEAIAADGRVVAMDRRILLQDIPAGRLRYFARGENGNPGTWQESWKPGRVLPALIAIEIDTHPHRWPPFAAAPKLE